MAEQVRPSVVVTGAGRGVGAGIAAAAVDAGWVVGVLDVDGEAAERIASQLAHAVEQALDRFATETGREAPHGVVGNAGIVRFGPLADLTAEDWRSVVDVNLTGTFLTARAAARRMIAAGTGGSIVTITSMNGVEPAPNAGAYGATKAGIALLTQQMALEWGPAGIRVNAVAPGLIDAGMSEPIYADDEIRALRESRVPLGRLGTADDIARVVLFLLSDEAAYVTGTELLVDGGVTRGVISSLPRPKSVDSVGRDGP